MIQRGGRFGLLLKAQQALGIERNQFGKDLDRDVAVQARYRARDTPRPCCPRQAARVSRTD